MNGKIYGIRNKITDKFYIGQTTWSVRERFQRHTSSTESNKRTAISKAIKSYGKENFEFFTIRENIASFEEMNETETFYIQKYNSMTPNGYNLCPGGQSWRREPNITKENLEKAIKEYTEDGKSLRFLSEKYGASKEYLSRNIKGRGFVVRNSHHKLPDRTSRITREIMEDLYLNKGLMIKEIAEELGVSPMTINRAKRRYELSR